MTRRSTPDGHRTIGPVGRFGHRISFGWRRSVGFVPALQDSNAPLDVSGPLQGLGWSRMVRNHAVSLDNLTVRPLPVRMYCKQLAKLVALASCSLSPDHHVVGSIGNHLEL